tara:strand:+ start:74 stop:421 length:348 start_codon:yes stop_codon:yes gene_type:complete
MRRRNAKGQFVRSRRHHRSKGRKAKGKAKGGFTFQPWKVVTDPIVSYGKSKAQGFVEGKIRKAMKKYDIPVEALEWGKKSVAMGQQYKADAARRKSVKAAAAAAKRRAEIERLLK